MRDITPTIWRLILVPDEFTLHRLHRVLQIVYSRLDYHLYSFDVGKRHFSFPDEESEMDFEDATAFVLRDLRLEVGSSLAYTYDFGDNWEHDLVVERVLPMFPEHPADGFPQLLGGERAAPPEDAGGSGGYERLLEALSDAKHPEHDEFRQWAGPLYDPERFDPWSLNHALILAAAWGAV